MCFYVFHYTGQCKLFHDLLYVQADRGHLKRASHSKREGRWKLWKFVSFVAGYLWNCITRMRNEFLNQKDFDQSSPKTLEKPFFTEIFFLSFWVKFETVFVGYFFKIYKSLYYKTLGLSILYSVIDVLTTFYVRFIIFSVFAFGRKLWVLTCQ